MSILGKLELNEQTDMEFGIDVYGTTEQTQDVRFVIEGKDFDISCKCKVENGEVVAHIPKLKGILEAGNYNVKLEVLVGDKYFCPLKEQIEFNPLVEFDIKTKKVQPVKEGVKVTVKNQVTSEDSKPIKESLSMLEKNIQKAIKEGYEVSKIGENYVMKKGELYAGIISEKAILKSKKLHESLTQLVEALS